MSDPKAKDETDAGPLLADEASSNGDEVDAQLLPGGSTEGSHHVYNMRHAKRGLLVIINNKTFQKETQMGERPGSDLDAANLEHTFKGLDFEVKLCTDLTCTQMLKEMTEAAKYDFSDSDCFACAILSHGDDGVVCGIDGIIEIDSLVAPFKGDSCISLVGKPKLFFIQACRGEKLDPGVDVVDGARPVKVSRIPTDADFLFAYSTTPGHLAWRHSLRGSWFVRALCNVLQKHGHDKELMELLTRTNRAVAYEFESNSNEELMSMKKQIPSIVSQLTKQVYFIPKKRLPCLLARRRPAVTMV